MSRASVALGAVVACLLWSAAFVFAKTGLRFLPPLTLGGFRFILAGLLLFPLALPLLRGMRFDRATLKVILLTAVFQTFLLYGLFFWGMKLARGAQAAVVVGSSPLTAALLSHFLMKGDRLTAKKMTFIALGLAGIILISLGAKPWEAAGLRELTGLAILLASGVASALGNIVVARQKNPVHPLALNAFQMLLGGVLLLAVALPMDGVPAFPTATAFWVALLCLAVISAAGFSIWFRLLKTVKVSELNVYKFVIPVAGALLSWTFNPGETPDALSIAGMSVVGVSILLYFKIAGDRVSVPPAKS